MNLHGPSSKHHRAARWSAALGRVFSFRLLLGCLLLVLALMTVRERFSDPDMWWHLKTGEIIWRTHAIPHIDTFSYTTGHHAYVPHEWLAQTLLYAVWLAGGYKALLAWLWLSTAFVLVGGYVLCSLNTNDARLSFAGALVVWFFGTIGYALRPQVIGYGLLILELLLLELGRTRDRRWLYALPPLFLVWVCCHGSFAFGLVVLAVTLAAAFVRMPGKTLAARAWNPTARRTLLAAAALCVAVLFLNPAGVTPIFYPLDTLFRQPLGLAASQEWQSAPLTDPRMLGLIAVTGCICLLPLVRRIPVYADELAIVLLAAWQAASHRRLLFAFGIVAAPVLCRMLSELWPAAADEEHHPWVNAALMTASALALFIAFPRLASLERQVHDGNPTDALAYIQSHHLAGPILNEYVFGGYLIWAAPEYPVFVDGRADVFEWTGVLSSFGRWATRQTDPAALPNRYGVNLCLLARSSPLVSVLSRLPGWKQVYADDRAVVLTRGPAMAPAAESASLR